MARVCDDVTPVSVILPFILGGGNFFLFDFSLTEVTPVELNGPCIVFQHLVQKNPSTCFLEVDVRQLLAWVGFKHCLKCFLEDKVIHSLWISKCYFFSPGSYL